MNFTCRKLTCEHNKNCICTAENVTIDKDIHCKMFKKNNNYPEDKTKTMFDKVPEFEPFKHNKFIKITCHANCVFNRDNDCISNGILVNETHSCPAKCFSYLKK